MVYLFAAERGCVLEKSWLFFESLIETYPDITQSFLKMLNKIEETEDEDIINHLRSWKSNGISLDELIRAMSSLENEHGIVRMTMDALISFLINRELLMSDEIFDQEELIKVIVLAAKYNYFSAFTYLSEQFDKNKLDRTCHIYSIIYALGFCENTRMIEYTIKNCDRYHYIFDDIAIDLLLSATRAGNLRMIKYMHENYFMNKLHFSDLELLVRDAMFCEDTDVIIYILENFNTEDNIDICNIMDYAIKSGKLNLFKYLVITYDHFNDVYQQFKIKSSIKSHNQYAILDYWNNRNINKYIVIHLEDSQADLDTPID